MPAQYEIPEDFVFRYPWAPSTRRAAYCMCVTCGAKAQAVVSISEYPFRFIPENWHTESRTKALRCPKCVDSKTFQPDFYAKYEAHVSQGTEGSIPHLLVKPRERMWMDGAQMDDHEMEASRGRLAGAEDVARSGREARRAVAHTAGEERMADAEMGEVSSKDFKARAKDHFTEAGGALAMGLKLAAVNEGGEILLDIAKEIGKDVPMVEAMLESPEGRELAKLIAAFTVSGMCTYTDFVPKKEIVQDMMAMQMTVSGFQLAAPRMKVIRQKLQSLAGIGEKLGDIGENAGIRARVSEDEEPETEEEVEVEEEKAAKKKTKKK